MKRAYFLAIIVALTAALMPLAHAQETVWEMAESGQYGHKVAGMLGRGLINVATCFVDLIVQTVEGTQEGPPVVGTLTGLGGGIACTALRAGSGVVDVATFWVPDFNGLPVARSYSDCLLADYSAAVQSSDMAQPSRVAQSSGMAQSSGTIVSQGKPANADPMQYVKK
ncbi:MAG: hypothetical protein Q8R76_04135 [Candidatus Omnitrophota bacterium]|nr:hypothetical protein [Candidatus Omnitrophota bacterium]